ncbi:hypothetical protein AGMMS49975_27160 [Clostridia bacterium]|nr:hypothetical protein AGMMS49975_27160 [Clostridia bacterium]
MAFADTVLVTRGDIPLLKPSTIRSMTTLLESLGADMVAVSNYAVCVFTRKTFDKFFRNVSDVSLKKQSLSGIKNKIIFKDYKEYEVRAVDSLKKLEKAARTLQKRVNRKLAKNGVLIEDAKTAYIGIDAQIAANTVIAPNTQIYGDSEIGADCAIGPNTQIYNALIGDRTTVSNSVVFDSVIGNGTNVGPFAYIRPHCVIGNFVKVGDFVEVKNSNIGDNTKMSHLTYIGDSDLGSRVNVGCGTVTVNYDGKNKHRTVIQDNVFVGCNANFVAPVTVGQGAFIAAGSTITEDVPENALGIARERQTNKTDWKGIQK